MAECTPGKMLAQASGRTLVATPLKQASNHELGAMPSCGLVVFESRHVSGVTGLRREAFSKFVFVLAGHSLWEGCGRTHLLGPDTLCHIPAGQPHRQEDRPNDPVMEYVIHYRPELLAPALHGQLSALGLLALDLGTANITQPRVVRSIVQEMLFEQSAGQEGCEMILHSRLIDLAVRALRLSRRRRREDLPLFEPGSDSAERVAKYALRLKSRFYRQEAITEAARSVGLGRRQFTELFHKVTGQPWRRYILDLRLKHAAALLTETDRSVQTVAFESGFDDLSNFYHSFRAAYGCSPLAYREQRKVRLPVKARAFPEPSSQAGPGFNFRGLKGWRWSPEQYLEEIPFLPVLKLNFLMNCALSMLTRLKNGAWINEWWKPMSRPRQQAYAKVIRACRAHGVTFCFALNPQLASPRPLNPASPADLAHFFHHYDWAQSQEVQWFAVLLDDVGWGHAGPAAGGSAHARLVNALLERLRARDPDAQLLFCPPVHWGDGTNLEHRTYLEPLARELHPDIFVFWNGDGVVTPRITRVAAESFKSLVKHRLFLWDNYPDNDGSPTLHLGPLRGREPDLPEVIDGYLSNPLASQNEVNRIPLATCADYAYNPRAYDPARAIGQAILQWAKTEAQQRVLCRLVEAYPGFIVVGGGTGTNPVRGKFVALLGASESRSTTQAHVRRIQEIYDGLNREFPNRFAATKRTVAEDVTWMRARLPG
jgi:AraC-like DNA-binding protein